ncbi:MAG: hypothetical protein K2O05_04430 [Anaeroplasmataceae bacterium]|nr:hypothetical protein [Anaeroplasmataceae bacterium]
MMAIIKQGVVISKGASIDDSVQVGEYSVIGNGQDTDNIRIKANTVIHRFCFIDRNTQIGKNCLIGDGVYIYKNCTIGDNVKILCKSVIDSGCQIANGCIIDANIANKVIMEENVRFFGQIAHSHRNHTLDWKTTSEPSPIFRKNSIVGVGALIIGDVEVGEGSYVAAGEILRCNLPANSVYYQGKIYPKKFFRGLII